MADRKQDPRRIAFRILMRMGSGNTTDDDGGGYSNRLLDSEIEKSGIAGADRSLLSRLVSGVTERRITLDYIISRFSKRPPEKLDFDVLCLLRMGIYQLRYLDRIPTHAAVNETVNLAKQSTRGFINAILRSYLRAGEIEFPKNHEDEYLSLAYSAPRELCRKYISLFGRERAESILASYLESPALTLRVNTLCADRDSLTRALADDGIDALPTENSPYGLRVSSGHGLPSAIAQGLAFVQDEASQLAVLALDPRPGDILLDCCACPGGKSFSAAMLMENRGSITSCDLHSSKLPLISSGAERLGIGIIKTVCRDSSLPIDSERAAYSKIICDVPCSGLGVAAKKTEIKYRPLSQSASLPALQYKILSTVSEYLDEGGTLIYSTCTILPEENEEVVEKFLSTHPEFIPVSFTFGSLSAPQGMITLLPEHGSDGFFICKLRKERNDR